LVNQGLDLRDQVGWQRERDFSLVTSHCCHILLPLIGIVIQAGRLGKWIERELTFYGQTHGNRDL
jgi:hypothetical protein